MSKIIKAWIKEIFRSVIKEEIQNRPLIIANRAPSKGDIYEEGTIWAHQEETYKVTKVDVCWEKL